MQVEYTHRVSERARSMRISVGIDGVVVVTTPRWVRTTEVERFVEKHREWIEREAARAARRLVIRVPRKDLGTLKAQARTLAEERCAYYASMYGLTYNKITIRAQKSRWGSCSVRGTLSFNYKIMALPPHIADYIIVHEICHLAQMNHLQKFWDLVAQTVPNHKDLRKQLRRMHVVVG